jgi:putative ABC transport system substrate-binding protein
MHCCTIGLSITIALSILFAPLATEAQPPPKVPRIGCLSTRSPADASAQSYLRAFRQGLRELGYVEGQNIAIEYRWAEGQQEVLPHLAAELVRLQVDVIVTSAEPAIRAAKEATAVIPIVMAVTGDPVGSGLVASLARPGGNITGLSLMGTELGSKLLELLKQAAPKASRIAVLWNAAYPVKARELAEMQAAARLLGMTLHPVEVRALADFDTAFASMTRERPHGLITVSDPLTLTHRRQIVDFAAHNRLPMISEVKEFAEAGGLMTYGPSLPDMFRRAAYYVERILKGAKPTDLPVEQPTKFELVLNRKTAQALGITFPPTLLVLADEVIQ